MKRPLLFALIAALLALIAVFPAQSQDNYIRSPHLGITNISAPGDPILDQRYQNALLLGAGWNRWPLYWNSIESADGNDNWSGYDQLVANDVHYGLQSDAIFIGTPPQDQAGVSIKGLNEPAFSDGTDTPGAGKQPNPANPYARFVYASVQRYMPGGTLAQQLHWQPNQGIRIWEAWNEPDLPIFWSAPVEDYERLLKVTYLLVHQADPLAQVMFAGLAFDNPDVEDYLAYTLQLIAQDPQHDAYHWYFDIAAVHSYSSARRSAQMVQRVKQDLAKYQLDRPVWLNESGIPVWDDYPGPTWTVNNPAGHQYRGTLAEQALYVAESTTLAWASGADVVFIFQLYDDCGNQPSGTDFPPNSGQAGDAYGLFRNARTSPCFSQSPQPNTPRPAASVYYRLAQLFGSRQFNGGTIVDLNGQGSVLAFDFTPLQGVANYGSVTSGASQSNVIERAYVMWNRSHNRLVVEVPASGPGAQLYDLANNNYQLTPQDANYEIGLPAVSASDYPDLSAPELAGVSGAPYILIEQVQSGWTPVDPNLVHIQGQSNTPSATEEPSPTFGAILLNPDPATATPIPRPTTDPALDHTPPTPLIQALAETSPTTFTVHWGGIDDSGIASYIVWVRVDGGAWQKWLETSDTQADYTGTSGSTYEFALWAEDLAGNWSQNIDLAPQAETKVQ